VPVDWFFGFWLPITLRLPAEWVWATGAALTIALLTVPLWTRPGKSAAPAPSAVDERYCTGCVQCSLDCPYEAIAMIARSDDRPTLVARVTPERCVSCGICAGSCGPMAVGPPGRTGRDQLTRVRRFLEERRPAAEDIVLVACSRGAGEVGAMQSFADALVYPADCIGSLHSSVVEFLIRSGVGGVLVAGCPERDCWNREGTKWARARLLHDRDAKLQARVDRARVRFVEVGAAERAELAVLLAGLRRDLAELAPAEAEPAVAIAGECDLPARTLDAHAEEVRS
jgi:coenzyme F420-reducing hydrogenase delta subunit/NAD-dependent dihydropyrimidine dehydrogenase PreA subunit